MQQSGEYRIGAPVGAVWAALNDPDVLARCIEGCQSLEKTGENTFHAVVKAKVGPVSATFTGEVALADLDPPNSYTIQASAKGGQAGFGKGTARVRLADDGGATVLHYDVEGSVGGKLAQIGQRLVDGAARKMADDFFACFAEAVAPAAVASTPAPAAARSGLPASWIIAALAIAAVAIVTVVVVSQ